MEPACGNGYEIIAFRRDRLTIALDPPANDTSFGLECETVLHSRGNGSEVISCRSYRLALSIAPPGDDTAV